MIKQLCAKHQLNGDVVAKASEFERLLTMKNIRLTEGEVGKHAIFVALAIEVLPQQQQQLSSSSSSSTNNSSSNASIADSLFNSSGLTRDIYSHTYAKIKAALNIQPDYSIARLCQSVELPSLIGTANKIFESYKSRKLAKLSDILKRSANFDAPVFSGLPCVGISLDQI